MATERWKPNVTVAAVAERDGRFLFVEETIGGRRVLNQPAGHLDEGESLLDAVVRETREETAWRFTPACLVGIYRYSNPWDPATYLRFCFAGTVSGHDPDAPLDTAIVGTVWLTAAELAACPARHRTLMVERCVADYLAGRRHPLDLLADIRQEEFGLGPA